MYKLRQSINYSALYSSRVLGILVGWVDFSTVGNLESGRSQSWNIQILQGSSEHINHLDRYFMYFMFSKEIVVNI